MKYRLLNALVKDPSSPQNGQTCDWDIINGHWHTAKGEADAQTNIIDLKGKCILPGFCEMYAYSGDPGHEYREDLETLAKAASKGGFTAVAIIPDASPVTQHKTHVAYLVNKGKHLPLKILPYGAVSEDLKGKKPTEMYDMNHAGAVAFTDAPHPVSDSGVMLRALQYVQPFNGVILQMPYDVSLVGEGQINEGLVSVQTGMKGISHLSETMQVYRDLELLKYTGGRLHFIGISTAAATDMIRKAKAEGWNVSASVFIHHLLLDENALSGFDTLYKVMPPLRTQEDIDALLEGLKDGTIDTLSTQHTPLDTESKRLEFEYATPGMSQIELAYSLSQNFLSTKLDWNILVNAWSHHPRKILGQPAISIQEGHLADFIVVDENETFTVNAADWASRSFNTPFDGHQLKGKVKAVFYQQKWNENE